MMVSFVPAVGGVSRAPTLGARTPLPLRDALGQATMLGPLGGGVAAKRGNSGKENLVLPKYWN